MKSLSIVFNKQTLRESIDMNENFSKDENRRISKY